MRLFLAYFLFFFSVTSYANQWYHVEMIVFEQLNTISDERWPIMPEMENDDDFLTPTMATNKIQPDSIQTLVANANRLNRSSAYRVHYHQAWQQPISKKRQAMPLQIHSENDMVHGSLRLYKSTYLHAAVDLWLVENKLINTDWTDIEDEGANINEIRNPNLTESRRIRSKKLYFFDHPKMGVLLEITPIDTPEAVQAESDNLETFSLPTEASATSSE